MTRIAGLAMVAILAAGLAAPMSAPAAATPRQPDSGMRLVLGDDAVRPPSGAPATPTLRNSGSSGTRPMATNATVRYDVVVIALNMPSGRSPATLAASKAMVATLDQEFARETNGRYRFQFRSLQSATSTRNVYAVEDAMRLATWPTTPLTGSVGVLPVVVTWGNSSNVSGEAYVGSPGAIMRGGWIPGHAVAESVFAHEIGHNLGLEHAGSVEARADGRPWPAGTAPGVSPYGDDYDVMGGRAFLGLGFHLRLNAYNLQYLGVFTAADALVVDRQGTQSVTLPARYGATGPRMAYLPWRERGKFVLEYRPAVGLDSALDGVPPECDTWPRPELADWGACDPGAGSGVLVRMGSLAGDDGPEPYSAAGVAGTVLLPGPPAPGGAEEGDPRGGALTTGETLRLPDGTTIVVASADAAAARLTITRPKDTSRPTLSVSGTSYCGVGQACTGRVVRSSDKWSWKVRMRASDNVLTREVGFRIKGPGGSRVQSRTVGLPSRFASRGAGQVQTMTVALGLGTWKVTPYAKDGAGATTTGKTTTIKVVKALPKSKWGRTTLKELYSWPSRAPSQAKAGGWYMDMPVVVTPGRGRSVVLQKRDGSGSWRTYKAYSADTRGRAKIQVPFLRGKHSWRITVPASADHQAKGVVSAAHAIRL